MGLSGIREELHRYINNADERILNLMYAMMKADTCKDEALDASIGKALEQSKNGQVCPHETVIAEIRACYMG